MGLLFPLHVAVKLSPAGTELGLAEIEAVVGIVVFVCVAIITSAYLYVVPEVTPEELVLEHATP